MSKEEDILKRLFPEADDLALDAALRILTGDAGVHKLLATSIGDVFQINFVKLIGEESP